MPNRIADALLPLIMLWLGVNAIWFQDSVMANVFGTIALTGGVLAKWKLDTEWRTHDKHNKNIDRS